MLGVLHRACKRRGPKQLQKLFKRSEGDSLEEPDLSGAVRILKRSAFGLVPVYNELPGELRALREVRAFQAAVQNLVKEWAAADRPSWKSCLCPRARSQ